MEFPTNGPVTLQDSLDVAKLVNYLCSSSRTRPVAALTIGVGEVRPYVDADELASQADNESVVVTITEELTWRFNDQLPNKEAGVFGGACRVYPVGDEWQHKLHKAPLRLARNAQQIANLPGLISDDLKKAIDAAKTPPPPPKANASAAVTAPVDATPGPVALQVNVPASIEDEVDVAALREYLFSSRRELPVVLVSRAAGEAEAFADVEQLREQLTGLADVFEITTAKASWAFADAVPPMCQVYGGASRAYPVGQAWVDDPTLSPLRFAYGLRDREETTRQLVSDTMRMASRGSYATRATTEKPRKVHGKVMGVAGGRGLVNLDGGTMATLWPELTQPDVPAEQLFANGMEVTGELDPESHRIDVRDMLQAPLDAVAIYEAGQTILVKVTQVSADSCTVELFPDLAVTIPAQDVTDEDDADLRALMTPGETVAAYFGGHEDGEWQLSLADAEDDANAVPAASILAGGPPWLVVTEPEPEASPQGGPGEQRTSLRGGIDDGNELVRELRREIQQLADQVADYKQQVADLNRENASLKKRNFKREKKTKADRLANEASQAEADLHLFDDEADQLDFEIRLAWARKTTASDKKTLPLKKWQYGDNFFSTLHEVQGVPRDKIVEVIVDALTGRDAKIDARYVHQLRTGPGGDDPVRTREGGEMCWRSAIQQGTPQARRLHYWKCNDGSIELASVRLHDDFRT